MDNIQGKGFSDQIVEYPLIKLEGVRGIDYLYGLFFCAGEITRNKHLFHRPVSGSGLMSRIRSWLETVMLIQKAYRSAMAKNRLEDAIRVNRNQRGAVVGHFFILLITTLEKSFRGVSFQSSVHQDSA